MEKLQTIGIVIKLSHKKLTCKFRRQLTVYFNTMSSITSLKFLLQCVCTIRFINLLESS